MHLIEKVVFTSLRVTLVPPLLKDDIIRTLNIYAYTAVSDLLVDVGTGTTYLAACE
jgi:hypothetical protein